MQNAVRMYQIDGVGFAVYVPQRQGGWPDLPLEVLTKAVHVEEVLEDGSAIIRKSRWLACSHAREIPQTTEAWFR